MVSKMKKENCINRTVTPHFELYLKTKLGINEDNLLRLIPLINIELVNKNDFLVREGDNSRYEFFVERGLLRSYTIDQDGRHHTIQFAPENSFISDRSNVYLNEPSMSFIEAIEDSYVIKIDNKSNEFIRNISSDRGYNEITLNTYIRNLEGRVNGLLGAKAKERYLHFISHYSKISVRIPQWMIASYLGITRETLSRVRKELAANHYI
jgi:CRP-like cAMP-binding protein